MEPDQLIFKKVLNYFKKRSKINHPNFEKTIYLDAIAPRLTILARAFSGAPINIVPSEREGGWKDQTFFLPKEVALFSSEDLNAQIYLFRVVYLSVQRNLNLNWQPHSEEKTIEESQLAAKEEAPAILKSVEEEYPNVIEMYNELHKAIIDIKQEEEEVPDFTWLYGRFMKNTVDNPAKDLEQISTQTSDLQPDEDKKDQTEIKANKADELEVLTVDKKAQEEYMLTHNFEKVETADNFDGVWRDFDGDDELEDHADALDEINISKLVRVDDPVHSIYKAEISEYGTVAQSKEVTDDGFFVTYPEWHHKSRVYQPDFCKVYPLKLMLQNEDYYRQTLIHNKKVINELKRVFARLNNSMEQIKRQSVGDHVDIDAVTDMLADVHARHTPDEKLYISKRKKKQELSLLFLLDLSLSSDGYAKGNRIIDIEKQVSIIFGEILHEYEVDFQIDGFYSKTRNNTSYVHLKTFDQPWDKAKNNIGSVQPQGYTRIGPALRHATYLLKKRENRKKWLILLSDGKPNDYDQYEGKYGMEDVKQALKEMNADHINNYAVAIEEQAKYYLPQMFGNNHYSIISSPVEMVHSLTKLYKRIERL